MRILLHPRAVASSSSASKAISPKHQAATACASIRPQKSPSPSQKENDPRCDDTCDPTRTTVRTWGQQCSPTCGCVVRFECILTQDNNHLHPVILHATYHAKNVVTVSPGLPIDRPTSAKQVDHRFHSKTISTHSSLHAIQTRKGRPMFRDCACPTLHHLSTVMVKYMKGKSLPRLQSEMDFQSVRSSPAFRQAVLSIQELPPHSTHCFDVFEEALTASMKGYLPGPRSFSALAHRMHEDLFSEAPDYEIPQFTTSSVNTAPTTLISNQQPGSSSSSLPSLSPFSLWANVEEDGHRNSWPFSKWGWLNSTPQQESSFHDIAISAPPRTSLFLSALAMLDWHHQQQEELEKRERAAAEEERLSLLHRARTRIHDWVTYVDELNRQAYADTSKKEQPA